VTIHLKHGPCSDHAFVTYIVPIALPQFQEYVDDTEDYINIMLDEKQNQLLQMGRPANDGDRGGHCRHRCRELVRHEHPETDEEARIRNLNFWETTFGTVFGCLAMYLLAIYAGKRSQILH
jgi:hypothetical protein